MHRSGGNADADRHGHFAFVNEIVQNDVRMKPQRIQQHANASGARAIVLNGHVDRDGSPRAGENLPRGFERKIEHASCGCTGLFQRIGRKRILHIRIITLPGQENLFFEDYSVLNKIEANCQWEVEHSVSVWL